MRTSPPLPYTGHGGRRQPRHVRRVRAGARASFSFKPALSTRPSHTLHARKWAFKTRVCCDRSGKPVRALVPWRQGTRGVASPTSLRTLTVRRGGQQSSAPGRSGVRAAFAPELGAWLSPAGLLPSRRSLRVGTQKFMYFPKHVAAGTLPCWSQKEPLVTSPRRVVQIFKIKP